MKKNKFKAGEVITQINKGWKRLITDVYFINGKVIYTYYNEELDKDYHPTGQFDSSRKGQCSQGHLLQWLRK